MKKLLILLPVLVAMGTAGSAQGTSETTSETNASNQKSTEVEKSWTFKDCTEERVVPFNINKGAKEFRFTADSRLQSGELAFILVDPKGKTERAFSISASSDGKQGNGRATYEVKPPLEGGWKIKINTTNASGNFRYTLSY